MTMQAEKFILIFVMIFFGNVHSRFSAALLVLFIFFLLSCPSSILHGENPFSDKLEHSRHSAMPFKPAGSYEEALHLWRSPEEVHGWIAVSFRYDHPRAMRLSETHRTQEERLPIYRPSELFDRKSGMCVDLARFAVETLRQIDPASDPKYLRIEFEPMQIEGNTFRFHWLVRFKRGGKLYFFADSNRPVHIAGPYFDLRAFIDEYERYRGRKIVGFRELDSYEKQRRTRVKQQQASEKP